MLVLDEGIGDLLMGNKTFYLSLVTSSLLAQRNIQI